MNRNKSRALIFALAIMTTIFFSGAAQSMQVLTFDNNTGPAGSYTEAGMTITALAGSTSLVETSFGRWDVPCCPEPDNDSYSLTTGGFFDLLSIDIIHSDPGDPIVFEGYSGASLIASTTVNAFDFGLLSFIGFTGLDLVKISVTGTFTDPTFDNLTYQAASLPEPATLTLLAMGQLGTLVSRRRKDI